MEECKNHGFNPDTLSDDVKKLKEILVVKLGVCESDLATADSQLSPMLKEIE